LSALAGRLLRVTFDETQSGGEKYVFEDNLKIDCSGNRTASISTNRSMVTITNIPRELRDYLASKYKPINNQSNNIDAISGRVLIEAGNDASGYSQVFEGGVMEVSTGAPPDITTTFTVVSNFRYKGVMGSWSFGEFSTLKQLTEKIAGIMQLAPDFSAENHTLVNPQHSGTMADLPNMLDEIQGVTATVDRGILSVRDDFQEVGAQSVIEVNKDTGMVGTPRFLEAGIEVTMLFSPSIAVHSMVRTTSQLVPGTNGVWKVVNVFFELHNRENPFYYTLKCVPVQTQ